MRRRALPADHPGQEVPDGTDFVESLLWSIASALIVVSDTADIIVWNSAAERLLGWTAAEALGRTLVDLNLDGLNVLAHRAAADLRGTPLEREMLVRREDGTHASVLVAAACMPAGTVDSCGAVLTLADLTQRFEVEHELRLAQRALRVLVEQSADVVVLLDPSGMVRVVNSRVAERAGLVPRQMEGHGAFEFIHPDDVSRARSLLAEVVATDGAWRDVVLRLRGAGGRYHWMEGRAVNFLDEPGIAAIVVSAHDVTQRVEREEDLSRQATRDPLTGLLNRSVFATRLEHHVEHARRHGLLLTLFYWDVDGFKHSNDVAGHAVGDRVLVEIAERSTRTFRSEDTVARIGGDEFAACAEVSTEAQAAVVAERLLESLEFEVTLPDGRRLLMTASIGVAVGDPAAVAGCLSEADEAMYEAKRLGGHAISLRRIAPIDLDQPVAPQLTAREDR